MKLSLHASGRCHIRAPDPAGWRGNGIPPRFIDAWSIDPASLYQHAFGIVFPEQELRLGQWLPHKVKDTIWIEAEPGKGVEIALFLVRAAGDQSQSLASAGWTKAIVDTSLPDGRRLLVVAGRATPPPEKLAELAEFKRSAAPLAAEVPSPTNLRLLLAAGPDAGGARKFVEAAVP